MTRQAGSPTPPDPGDKRKSDMWRPIPDRLARVISLVGFTMIVVGSGGIAAVLAAYGFPGAIHGAPLELIKLAVGVLGSGIALLFAGRALRVKELTLQQAREDASDRRNKELQDVAAEFCEPTPRRIAHLTTLKVRARRSAADREYVVEVLCTYLRMQFDAPSVLAGVAVDDERHKQWQRDCEIRKLAQNVLADQLRPAAAGSAVRRDLDIDLTGAVLIDFDLSDCRVGAARFDGARFEGNSDFSATTFTGAARFGKATFTRDASFDDVRFLGKAVFDEVKCERYTTFHRLLFGGQAGFGRAVFERHAVFDNAVFAGDAIFDAAQFRGAVGFDQARFEKEVGFGGAMFGDVPTFGGVRFEQEANTGKIAFGGAIFAEGAPPEVGRFLADENSGKDGAAG